MADELLDLITVDSVGEEQIPPPIPEDMEKRQNWARQNIPGYIDAGVSVDIVDAPAASVQAVADAGNAETYDMTALESLVLIVDDTETRKKSTAGDEGASQSGDGPAVAIATGVDDQIGVALHGEANQNLVLGSQATGALIAAAIQAGVRGLTAASAENQAGYDGFVASYTAPSFATTLKTALANGVQVLELVLTTVKGLDKGDDIVVADQAGGPAAPFTRKVIDIERTSGTVRIEPFTPGEDIEVGALVEIRDDHYNFASGKKGADSAILFAAGGANDGSVVLKLTAATGAVATAGKNAHGRQTIPFITADFASDPAATAAEMAIAINKVLTGAIASDNAGTLRITSRKFGESANIRAVAEGAAQTALDLPTDPEVGTQTDVVLSLSDPTLVSILPFTKSTGVLGALVADLTIVRNERNKLVNVDGTDHGTGATIGWIVTSSPRTVISST